MALQSHKPSDSRSCVHRPLACWTRGPHHAHPQTKQIQPRTALLALDVGWPVAAGLFAGAPAVACAHHVRAWCERVSGGRCPPGPQTLAAMRVLPLTRAPSVPNRNSLASCATINCTPFASGACKSHAQVLRPQHLSFAAPAWSAKACDTTLSPALRTCCVDLLRQRVQGRLDEPATRSAPAPNRPHSALHLRQKLAWPSLAVLCSVLAWLAPLLALRWPGLSLFTLPSWTSLGLCLGTLACIAAGSHAQRNSHPSKRFGFAIRGAGAAEHLPSMNPSPPIFWR